MKIRRQALVISPLVAALVFASTVHASTTSGGDLLSLSLEQLGAVEVTSVSRKRQSVAETASAVHVVTAEDIRRSGATSIPEALIGAPGVYVARINSGRWAVSVRHQPGRFSRTLLVLLDGRSVFSDLFRGVFWENVDVPMHDIERIEVIRGPGASVWGSNAIDGVINIITRKATSNSGRGAMGVGNTQDVLGATLDTGLAEGMTARVFARIRDYEPGKRADGGMSQDGGRLTTAGLRLSHSFSGATGASLSAGRTEANLRDEVIVPVLTAPYFEIDRTRQRTTNTYVNLRVDTQLGGGEFSFQANYGRENIGFIDLDADTTTMVVDVQHRMQLTRATDVVWGGEIKRVDDRLTGARLVSLVPVSLRNTYKSAFVHAEHALVPGHVRVIAGGKIEKVGNESAELQPTLRAVFTPKANHSFWAAASRPSRPVSRAERDVRYNLAVIPPNIPGNPSPLPILVQLRSATESLKPLKADVYEAGWRWEIDKTAKLDMAWYHSRYNNLPLAIPTDPQLVLATPPHLLQPLVRQGGLSESARGVEIALDWRPAPAWKLRASANLTREEGFAAALAAGLPASILEPRKLPRSVVYLAAAHDLSGQWTADVQLRHLGGFRGDFAPRSHSLLDARIAWRPLRSLELALVGRGLNRANQLEFVTDFLPTPAVQTQRSVQLRAHWKF